MKRSMAVMALLVIGCTAPPRVITLPNEGLGAFTYDIPAGRKSWGGLTVAVVRPEVELRGALGRQSGDSHLGEMAGNAAVSRSGLGGIGMVAGAAAADEAAAFARTEAEVDKKISALLDEFLESATRDAGLAVMAKGFETAGLFKSVGDMTFDEKRKATVALIGRFSIVIDKDITRKPTFLSPVEGVAKVSGEAMFFLIEPLSGEKLWSKSIRSAGQRAKFSVREEQNFSMQTLTRDDRPEAVGKALQGLYKEILGALSSGIDPAGWNRMEEDAIELKRRASPIMK